MIWKDALRFSLPYFINFKTALSLNKFGKYLKIEAAYLELCCGLIGNIFSK